MSNLYESAAGRDIRPGSLDPDRAADYALALSAHAGRWQTIPRLVKVATPGAGVDWTKQVDPGVVWRILSVSATLTTGAAAANRVPRLAFSDGTDDYFTVSPFVVQTASLAVIYLGSAIGASGSLGTFGQVWPLPSPTIPVLGSTTIRSVTTAIDAADQWTKIILYVLETRKRTPNERAQYWQALVAGEDPDPYPGLLVGD